MSEARPPLHPSARWISREFAELLGEEGRCTLHPDGSGTPFDYLVIGSGYGAAVCAAELARIPGKSVCVLERGREYLPGSFPSRMADLPIHVRGNALGRVRGGEALFDIRAGADVNVVLANGLGGGSLINAGVMFRAPAHVFDDRWPQNLRAGAGDSLPLDPFYARLEPRLGAVVGNEGNTLARANKTVDKRRVLAQLAAGAPRRLPIATGDANLTIAVTSGHTTSAGVRLSTCTLCGDCAMGCNYGAKESLDTNLLVSAMRSGASIYCGATVLRLQRPVNTRTAADADKLWCVLVTHTEEKLRLREGGPRWICARNVVLAAGSLGSTEILLRSQRETGALRFSPQLGRRFSTNGDMAVIGYNYDSENVPPANAIADEDQPPGERKVGPTITGYLSADMKVRGRRRSVLVQEMSVAGPLRRAFEEGVATVDVLHGMESADDSVHAAGWPAQDPFAVHPGNMRRTSAFAAMGDDGAEGTLQLGADGGDWGSDGHVTVAWPRANRATVFAKQFRLIRKLSGRLRGAGRTLPNPLWRLLPKKLAQRLDVPPGPLLTVHPLGGCAMADTIENGVVDAYGRVYDGDAASGARFHDGLYVLDGSIVPTALCANPALTIAALALRGVENIKAGHREEQPASLGQARPWVAYVEDELRGRPPAGTTVGITERLAGKMRLLLADGCKHDCRVELTLTYAPTSIDRLFRPRPDTGALTDAWLTTAGGGRGELRVMLHRDWDAACRLQGARREAFEQEHSRTYELRGTLSILKRHATTAKQRVRTARRAWVLNRGLRDICEALARGAWAGAGAAGAGLRGFASRAGEIRTFEYELTIGDEIRAGARSHRLAAGRNVRGHKCITYARPSNPWRQLQELTIDAFPGATGAAILRLDPRHFARRNRPLIGIEAQRDHAEALADLASLAAYFLRMLVSIHFWSARLPDAPAQRRVDRLPGRVRGLEPEIHWLEVDRVAGEPVRIRLARYGSSRKIDPHPPVLFIHGYSASGTTYVHPELKPGLAEYMAREGERESWVLDMRSSPGLPTGTLPWTMERIAMMDIPAAVDYVCRHANTAHVDVVAHCMGAVMLSMAVLSGGRHAHDADLWTAADAGAPDRFRTERSMLPSRIRRAVLSQNGPAMVMTDPNIFRTYVLSYFEDVLRPNRYHFRPEPEDGTPWRLLDRLFATLPYEDDELKGENSPWIWQSVRDLATRHRMDALYGRTFQRANLGKGVRCRIDDFFGPLSLDTLGQALHFGRLQTIANRAGRNRFLDPTTLRQQWRFPTLLVHGRDNGMADIATLYRIGAIFEEAGFMVTPVGARPAGAFGSGRVRIEQFDVPGFGHQDCLIGEQAPRKVFPQVLEFLDAD